MIIKPGNGQSISIDHIIVVDVKLNMRLGYVVEIDLETRKVKRLINGEIIEYPDEVRFEIF